MRLGDTFFGMDVLLVAPRLIGTWLCRRDDLNRVVRRRITEVEAYRGEEDSACHARAGKTARTAVMYLTGGHTYVYLCYGIHHLLNIVTGEVNQPQAVLIRGIESVTGPGRVTKALGITLADNRIDLCTSDRLWIEDDGHRQEIKTGTRIGIGYATLEDQAKLWRYWAFS